MTGRRGSTDGVLRKGASPSRGPSLPLARAQPASPWQAPGDVLDPVLELLLTLEDGPSWLRVASHVCSFWRSAALEILLADTAISKPPLEDFRAIGAHQSPGAALKEAVLAKPEKSDTVATQAAVVIEATASTGVEAISKQRFDAPPAQPRASALRQLAPHQRGSPSGLLAVSGLQGGRLRQQQRGSAAHQSAAAEVPNARALQAAGAPAQRSQQRRARGHAAAAGAVGAGEQQGAAAAAAADAAAEVAVAVAPPVQAAAAAAASPNRRQRAAAPSVSIQSDVAATGLRRARAAPCADSESDGGSTLAQGGPAMRRRRHSRGGSVATASVEQPVHQAPAHADGAGPSGTAPANRSKRPLSGGAHGRPSKRAAAAGWDEAGWDEVEQRPQRPTPVLRRGTRSGLRSQHAAGGSGDSAPAPASAAAPRDPEVHPGPSFPAAAVAAAVAAALAEATRCHLHQQQQQQVPQQQAQQAQQQQQQQQRAVVGEVQPAGPLPHQQAPHHQQRQQQQQQVQADGDSEVSGSYFEAAAGTMPMDVDEPAQPSLPAQQQPAQQQQQQQVHGQAEVQAAIAQPASAAQGQCIPPPQLPQQQAGSGAVQGLLGAVRRWIGLA